MDLSARPLSPHEPTPEPPHRFPALDGVRGLIMILVAVGHVVQFNGMGEVYWKGLDVSSYSNLDQLSIRGFWLLRSVSLPCMDLFFVLSSFLITGILLETRKNPGYFRIFYARRSLRIFPLYFFALAGLLLITYCVDPHEPFLKHQLWFWTYLSNYLLVQGWWRAPEQFRHFWSLAVEEQFYLFWPATVLLLNRRALKWFSVFALVGALAFRLWVYSEGRVDAAYLETPARADQLAAGALLAIYAREAGGLTAARLSWARAGTWFFSICIAGLMIWRGGLNEPDPYVGTIGHTIFSLFGACGLCLLIASPSWAQRFFSGAFLRTCGKYSYALYVFHQPVVILLVSILGFNVWRIGYFKGFVIASEIAVAVISFGFALGLAKLSWKLLEEPCLRLRPRFELDEAPTPKTETTSA